MHRTFLPFIVFIFCALTYSYGQNADTRMYLEEARMRMENSFNYTIEMARKMPEEHYNFKPHEEMMTFKEQLLHMLTNVDWLNTDYFNNQVLDEDLVGNLFTKDEIIELLETSRERCLALFSSVSPNQLNDEVRFFAGPKTKRQILALLGDHMTHHKGQLVVYLRLKDIVPPVYRGW